MIIDAFIFYNELDLLNYRLHLLNSIVDYFILVESTHTFVGNKKPLIYQENKQLFSQFNSKIIHIVVNDFKYKAPHINFKKREQWQNEIYQRNCIHRGIEKLSLKDTDLILISDVDEIPNPNTLKNISNCNNMYALRMDLYYYNLNNVIPNFWSKVKILPFYTYKKLGLSCQLIRMSESNTIERGGWHLSYFGDKAFIKNKLKEFSHQGFNRDEVFNKIEDCVSTHKSLLGDHIFHNILIKNNDNAPHDYDKYLQKYI